MNLLHALILGIVEGVTEFLPISSTAHLILASNWLNIPQTDFQKFFEVFIQSGAILAVIFLYFSYVFKHKKIQWNVLLSFLPTAVVGLFLFEVIKSVFFESTSLIVGALILIGSIFILLEFLVKEGKLILNKSLMDISWQHALVIGLFQSLAVVPGVSRAGIVMVAMMLMKYKREDAAVYSFLLAIPTLLAAGALDFYKTSQVVNLSNDTLVYLIVGFVVSFATAYIAVKWLISYLQKHTLTAFGLYRIVLAIIVMLFLSK